MRNTRNPTRRNRNIGTAKAGHGSNNSLVIPENYRDSRVFWEKVDNYSVITKIINNREVKFVIEPTSRGLVHCSTVEDVTYLLSRICDEGVGDIGLFIFRQPKRKEEMLSPVWGRLGFDVSIDIYRGPAIFLEAIDIEKKIIWDKSLSPEKSIDLKRLKEDGHKIILGKRSYEIKVSPDSVRNTQLYRTIFHELGHWDQWRKIVLLPSQNGAQVEELQEAYFRIPSSEREVYANRYAEEMRAKLIKEKVIPFDRIINSEN